MRYIYIYIIALSLSICLSMTLDCFHNLAILNNAAMNMELHMSL